MKLLFSVFLILLMANAFGQEHLDLGKLSACELFKEKNDYDPKQRIEEIKSLNGTEVTVYQVDGNDNKIRHKYSGTVYWYPNSKMKTKDQAKVLIVKTELNDGQVQGYFPLTNDKNFRIYDKKCLDEHTLDY